MRPSTIPSKSSFIIALILIIPLVALPQEVIEVSGTISMNTLWDYDTVKVTGDLVVDEDVTLTINPGTWILFTGNYGMEIKGSLQAMGAPGDTIVFMRTDTLGFMDYTTNEGGWKGLEFTEELDRHDTSHLYCCRITFVKYIDNYSGAIEIYGNHKSVIRGCTIEQNHGYRGGGIRFRGEQGAQLWIDSCIIRKNYADNHGGGIYGSADFRITNSEISNNHSYKWGGGILLSYSDAEISGNVIRDNFSEQSGGAINNRYGSPTISNNIIRNNESIGYGGGIYCTIDSEMKLENNQLFNNKGSGGGAISINSSEPVIMNNIITNNETPGWGGAIYLGNNSHASIINNTICNNAGGNGGGLYCTRSTSHVQNTIFWGNTSSGSGDQVYIEDNFSSPDFIFSNIQDSIPGFAFNGGTTFRGNYEDNLMADPLFDSPSAGTGNQADAAAADWSLTTQSPCINLGSLNVSALNIPDADAYGNRRISHGRIDIGAVETRIPIVSVSGTIPSDSALVADTILVTGDIIIPDGVTLTIAPGSLVQFDGPYVIDNQGTLKAVGNIRDSIHFTCRDTAGFYDFNVTDGGWNGILMDNGFLHSNGSMNDNDSSLFMYCHFSFAKTDRTTGGGVMRIVRFSRLRIEHCVFERNSTLIHSTAYISGGAMSIENSDFLINHCRFSYNYSTFSGSAIKVIHSDLILKNSSFDHNAIMHYAQGYGAALNVSKGAPRIINCDFVDNKNDRGSSSGIFLDQSDPLIMNCRISNNITNRFYKASAIQGNFGRPVLINNLIINNNSYAMRFINSEGSVLINNSVANNNGPGILFDNSTAHIYNTIFSGNSSGTVSFDDSYGVSNDIFIQNCLLEGGIDSTYISNEYIDLYEDNIEIDPGFVQPSAGSGYNYAGLNADWSVDLFSPCINNGTDDIKDINLPAVDLAGNSRINSSAIDIGAYEDQGRPINITINPYGGSKCEGDSMLFFVEADSDASFQWQRDNSDIPGATSDSLFIKPITAIDEGVYRCRVENSYGSFNSGEAYLIVKSPPEIINESSGTYTESGIPITLTVFATGSNPIQYQWNKDGVEMAGENSPEIILPMTDSSYEGIYSCMVSNLCGSDESAPAEIYLAPQICMVTVSEITGHNLVVWEKSSKASVIAYNIFRESIAAGIYDHLATIPYDDLSVFVDTNADPTVQAYIYKITAVLDSAGNETDIDLCNPHKTVHLIVSTNPELNTTQLQWDRYYGFAYNTYTIYRSTTGMNFEPIHSLSANNNSWTDPEPSTGDLYYRIAVEKPDPCQPEGGGKKAGTGPFVHSLSNLDDNKLKTGENPPDSIYLTNHSIDENMLPGSLIGRLVTIDIDTLDQYTYQLVAGDGDDDNDSFTLIGDLLVSAFTFDFEEKNSYTCRIRTTDNAAYYLEKAFLVTINDAEEGSGTSTGSTPPDTLKIENSSILENNLFGDPVGKLETVDEDSLDIHTYQLMSGTGDDDNLKFMITGDVLRAAFSFDFEEKDQYTIRVRSTDLAGNYIEKVFVINIIDIEEPAVGLGRDPSQSMDIYPNPMRYAARIRFENPAGDPYRMIIADLSGKVYRSVQDISTGEYVLKRGELKSGLYFIELRGPTVIRGKLVIE